MVEPSESELSVIATRLTAALIEEIEARRQRRDVLKPGDITLKNILRGDRGNRDRDLLQILFPLSGGHYHLFEFQRIGFLDLCPGFLRWSL